MVAFTIPSLLFSAIATVLHFLFLVLVWGTRFRGSGKRGKHGQGKHDDKPMDGPNPDHKPTGGQNPTGTPTGTPNPDHKQKMKDGSDGGKQKGRMKLRFEI
jgi:hypothetical protein